MENKRLNTSDRLVFVATSDLSGILRGKSFPISQWEKRCHSGLGWTPANAQITCFDTFSDGALGAFGDLAFVPDAEMRFTLGQGEDIFDLALGDIRTLAGDPWVCCPRSQARRAIDALKKACGATLLAAFEHEFQIKNVTPRAGDGFGAKGFRDAKGWSGPFLAALAQTSCQPDSFMKEFGPSQYEVTIKPAVGLMAPDNAVHIHFSFVNDAGLPLTHDASDPHGMSEMTRHFIGGILHYLDQILAFLAPSEISYLRLQPNRWSAAYNNLGYRDREASVRICPVSTLNPQEIARQFNFEVRSVDAAASPYLAYAALVFAGTQGVKDRIEPPKPTEQDLSVLAEDELAAQGICRLPQNLDKALGRCDHSAAVRGWFGDEFVDLYVANKRGEMAVLSELDWNQKTLSRSRSVGFIR